MTYYCKVRAYTKIGAGPYTDPINVSTTYENPVPKLLVATNDAVRLSDLDREINNTITRHVAKEIDYLGEEDKIYWISEMQELVTSLTNGTNVTKILGLNRTNTHSLCVDWIARNLYWVEGENKDNNRNSYIKRLDLTMLQAGIIKYKNILRRGGSITVLDILPSLGYVNIFIYLKYLNYNILLFFNYSICLTINQDKL